MVDVELIEFKEPGLGQLYVSRIHWQLSQELLVEQLRLRFEPFGIIHRIKANEGQDSLWYAYVNFYSTKAAQKAFGALGQNCILQGHPCRVQKKPKDNKGRPLYVSQCEALANFYLGFNGWSSKILYHQLESFEGQSVTFATAVQLTFPQFEGQVVEGVGLSSAEFSSAEEKSSLIGMAQKSSKSAAVMNAFSKVILAVVHAPDGFKVMVRTDPSQRDPFHYNSIWSSEDKGCLEVHHLPEEEDLFEK